MPIDGTSARATAWGVTHCWGDISRAGVVVVAAGVVREWEGTNTRERTVTHCLACVLDRGPGRVEHFCALHHNQN